MGFSQTFLSVVCSGTYILGYVVISITLPCLKLGVLACGAPAVLFFTNRSINVEESVLLIERSTAVNIVQGDKGPPTKNDSCDGNDGWHAHCDLLINRPTVLPRHVEQKNTGARLGDIASFCNAHEPLLV